MKNTKYILIILLLIFLSPTIVFAACQGATSSSACTSRTENGYKCKWNGSRKGGARCYKSNVLTSSSASKITSCSEIKVSSTCSNSKVNGRDCVWRQGACYATEDDGSGETDIDQSGPGPSSGSDNDDEKTEFSDPEITISETENICEGIFYKNGVKTEFGKLLEGVLKLIRYAAPLLVLALSSVDFLKAVISQNKDELTKAAKNSTIRLILAILLFFVPVLINYLLILIFGISDPTCGLL